MLLQVPSNLDECTLDQLVGLSDFATVMSMNDERNEEHSELLGFAIARIINQPISCIEVLTKKTLGELTGSIKETLETVVYDIASFAKGKNMAPVFECKPEDWRIIQSEYHGVNLIKRKYLDRKYKTRVYEVVQNPETLPAQIWIKMLDNLLKKKSRINKDNFWKEWNLIPTALACTAWGKNEKTHKKNEAGEVIVDMDRVRKMEEVFLQVPAKVGISAYGFFLASMNVSWGVNRSLSSVKK